MLGPTQKKEGLTPISNLEISVRRRASFDSTRRHYSRQIAEESLLAAADKRTKNKVSVDTAIAPAAVP
jgi:hypothetical protein